MVLLSAYIKNKRLQDTKFIIEVQLGCTKLPYTKITISTPNLFKWQNVNG